MVEDINRALLPVAGDNHIFRKTPPLLFGPEFVQKGKELVEQVKAMRSIIMRKQEWRPPFFRGAPHFHPQLRKGQSPGILPT